MATLYLEAEGTDLFSDVGLIFENAIPKKEASILREDCEVRKVQAARKQLNRLIIWQLTVNISSV